MMQFANHIKKVNNEKLQKRGFNNRAWNVKNSRLGNNSKLLTYIMNR